MDIAKLMVGFIVIAAVATLIAVAATYWYYIVGAAVVGYVLYAVKKNADNKRNRV